MAVTIFLIGPSLKLNFSSVLIFSIGMAFSDYLRAKILTGFPWNLWAYSFSWSNETLQILSKIDLYSFNYWLLHCLFHQL